MSEANLKKSSTVATMEAIALLDQWKALTVPNVEKKKTSKLILVSSKYPGTIRIRCLMDPMQLKSQKYSSTQIV